MSIFIYDLFINMLNISATASMVIIAVLIVRFLLKKTPKVFSYALWAVVLIRLFTPFSFESEIGLLPSASPIQPSSAYTQSTQNTNTFFNSELFNTQPNIQNQIANETLPNTTQSQNLADITPSETEQTASTNSEAYAENTSNTQNIGFALSLVWFIGVIGMLIYGMARFIIIKQKLIGSQYFKDNIYYADHISTPFVMGVIKPKIYLPSCLQSAETNFILEHEQCHIRRFDYITRILAYIALALHWFNPLVWVAFVFSGRDMEMACDEAVMQNMNSEMRAEYVASLLRLATGKKLAIATPIAFDNGDPKSRIVNIMKYKKPVIGVSIFALVIVVALSIAFMSTQGTEQNEPEHEDDFNNIAQSETTTPSANNTLTLQVGETTVEALYYKNIDQINADDLPVLTLSRGENKVDVNYSDAFARGNAHWIVREYTLSMNTYTSNKPEYTLYSRADYYTPIAVYGNKMPNVSTNVNHLHCYVTTQDSNGGGYAFRVEFSDEGLTEADQEYIYGFAQIYIWKDLNGNMYYSPVLGAYPDIEQLFDTQQALSNLNEVIEQLTQTSHGNLAIGINYSSNVTKNERYLIEIQVSNGVHGKVSSYNIKTGTINDSAFLKLIESLDKTPKQAKLYIWKDETNTAHFTLFEGNDVDKPAQEARNNTIASNDINQITQQLVAMGEYTNVEIATLDAIPFNEIFVYLSELQSALLSNIEYYGITLAEDFPVYEIGDYFSEEVSLKGTVLEIDLENSTMLVELIENSENTSKEILLKGLSNIKLYDGYFEILLSHFNTGDEINFVTYSMVGANAYPVIVSKVTRYDSYTQIQPSGDVFSYTLPFVDGYAAHTLTFEQTPSFNLALNLPSGWMVLPTKDEEKVMPLDLIHTGFVAINELSSKNKTTYSIYDASGSWVGGIGYDYMDDLQADDTNQLMQYYYPVALANNFSISLETGYPDILNGRLGYTEVKNENGTIVASSVGHYWENGYNSRYTKAILSHNVEQKIMLAIEFNEDALTIEQLQTIAQSIYYELAE